MKFVVIVAAAPGVGCGEDAEHGAGKWCWDDEEAVDETAPARMNASCNARETEKEAAKLLWMGFLFFMLGSIMIIGLLPQLLFIFFGRTRLLLVQV